MERLIWVGMWRKLWCTVGRSLISRERHMGSLRSRRAGRLSGRHCHTIFRARSLRRDHLVRVMEARRSISRDAIEHALELVWILGGGGGVEERSRRINGWHLKSTIVMAWKR